LQADGWYLRSDIIWSKPNPMPESVTDRPTKAHEYLFLLTKRARYYYDAEAVKEVGTLGPHTRDRASNFKKVGAQDDKYGKHDKGDPVIICDGTRNKRTVWTVATQPYSGAHFATFPPKLIEPCILAGTSDRGCCPECGAGWVRVVERVSTGKRYSTGKSKEKNDAGLVTGFSGYNDGSSSPVFKTTGWEPSCSCGHERTVPAVVLDPFVGSGTTVKVANAHGRKGVGLDISREYFALSKGRTNHTQRRFA